MFFGDFLSSSLNHHIILVKGDFLNLRSLLFLYDKGTSVLCIFVGFYSVECN